MTKLSFNLAGAAGTSTQSVTVGVDALVIAGWAGRDRQAIEHHIEELAAIGVPRPSQVPLYYRVAANQLCQGQEVQVVGNDTSGEAEAFVFAHESQLFISLASDHTDRDLERHSVALSKQICVKPVARDAWSLNSVVDHWDELVLRSWIEEDGQTVLYQDGKMAQLLRPEELITGCFGAAGLPQDAAMTCGTVAVQGDIRPSSVFSMEIHDPVLDRRIAHSYVITALPHVA